MYDVSSEYRTQIKQPLRNFSYVRILLSVVDPQAEGDSIASSDSGVYYSQVENIAKSLDVVTSYPTLEQNRFVLDGRYSSPAEPDVAVFPYQGYIGDQISESNGVFTTPDAITIDFVTSYFSLRGLTMSFDTLRRDFPKQIKIDAYNDLALVYSEIKAPDRYQDWVLEDPIPLCNKLVISNLQSTTPYRRFRLENILFGIVKVFTNDNIVRCSWRRDSDLLNLYLPKNEFDFTFIDPLKEYDPENATGIFEYLEEQQPVKFSFGYELNDGSIEWVPGGSTLSIGEIAIESSSKIPEVTFKSVSILNYLSQEYTEGVYYPDGITLYDLAEDVLQFCNIPLNPQGLNRWTLDSSLANYSTKVPLPRLQVRQCLQLIANAAMCVLGDDVNGNVVIAPRDTSLADFKFKLEDVLFPPKTTKYPVLQGVDTRVTTISPSASVTELGRFNIVGASNTEYTFSYNSATQIAADLGAGLTLEGTPEYFAGMTRISLTGTGVLTLSGRELELVYRNISVEYGTIGNRCPVENMLITDASHCISYATWVGDYIDRRNSYEISDRGFPELSVGDNILIDTLFTSDVEATLIASTIEFDGCLKGTSKLLIAE